MIWISGGCSSTGGCGRKVDVSQHRRIHLSGGGKAVLCGYGADVTGIFLE